MTTKSIALIPMRGGSKSIPGKNVALIAGKPLCYWAINAAIESNIFDHIYISTDAKYIIETVKTLFSAQITNGLIVLETRPAELAQDSTSTEEVIFHSIKNKVFDFFCLIQVTSPLISADDLREGYSKLLSGFDSVLSTCRLKRFFWSENGTPVNYNIFKRPRRQDFQGQLVENGAFYFSTKASLLEHKNRLGGKIGLYEMFGDSFFEIDEPSDFQILECLLINKRAQFRKKISKIEAIVIDVDGTLTDGGMYYGASGEELKKFNTLDAKGIALARERNIKIFILTAENSPAVHARFNKIQVDFYRHGVADKAVELQSWAKENNINLKNTLYIGDDLGDLDAMKLCGYRACPNNAVTEIKQISDYQSRYIGGNGAAREIISEFVLKNILID